MLGSVTSGQAAAEWDPGPPGPGTLWHRAWLCVVSLVTAGLREAFQNTLSCTEIHRSCFSLRNSS